MENDRSLAGRGFTYKPGNRKFGGGAGIWPACCPGRGTIWNSILSGSSIKSFTPDTADMSVAGTFFLTSIQERNSREAKKLGKRLQSERICATLKHNVTQGNIYLSGKIR
jgi:hypothetical protein